MADAFTIDPDAVLWSAPADERAGRPLLVLLHGYGSNEQDLFGLSPSLPDAFVVASLRAPLAPPFPTPGHSWFALEGPGRRDPDEVAASVDAVLAWLDGARGDAASVGLLGFSQGGAMALQILRTRPRAADFAVVLAGFALPGALPGDAELAEATPSVFWGRGARDEVISPAMVEHTAQWLPDHVDLSGRVYPGLTHSVSEEELADVRTFLEKQLAATQD
ncbi:dienelactone hydrolase family protein [Microbacterium sp. EYE_5]|uniref:alpha/beta hydrolase n=1 Tax=unclassified Microbacterium TaxID=2609290 RepID=UPI002004C6DC|nr:MULTISPECIES: dienelactone hydrolase family protein [unclassified Microbacterium]MCK6079920.1 dienelactone hydrolase family protein [Microbacterium sp. EYE_382]MCK6085191.1 dienelactone hydrolase family protein [Microbacterium sp. EYE_384]MCK6122583.1 dienelactone hydrolase family protein [Microbacterium sp. EYE_80]MCK6125954.1 dienelactone hydrolase family protein [Microbacterium sp. EYE_79]MCK6140875.1 dienelactone hydrolase family protein [Microbacterium sp. EYE_39]